MGDCPEKEKNREGAKESAHGIDHKRYPSRIAACEVCKEAGCEHEDRVARRVADFKFVSLNYEFTAIPIGGGRLKSEPISNEGDDENEPSPHVVDQLIFFRNHSAEIDYVRNMRAKVAKNCDIGKRVDVFGMGKVRG